MDIISGMNAFVQALGLVKQLLELDKAINEGSWKSKLVELQDSILEAKVALLAAKEANLAQATQISALKAEIEALKAGDLCPKCRKGRLKQVTSKPPRIQAMYSAGVQEWTMNCDNPSCDHSETKWHDPNGFLKK